MNPSLEGIRAITEAMGLPQSAFRIVQVAGTNGKSSVAWMVAALLRAHGVRAGSFTSPHLSRYEEQIQVAGASVGMELFAASVTAAIDAAEAADVAATEFELATAAALWAFRDQRVDWAVLEVGMGARWDATSVTSPAVSVLTGVALEHTAHLGRTREEIAADKAHVIKPGSVAVLGPGLGGVEAIVHRRAEEMDVPVVSVGEARSDADVAFRVAARPSRPGGELSLVMERGALEGEGFRIAAPSYQAPNVAVALAAGEVALGGAIDAEAARAALSSLRLPARFELLPRTVPDEGISADVPDEDDEGGHVDVVVDGAHNPQAARVLAGAIAEAFGETRPVLVLGVLEDKDAAGIVRALASVVGRVVVCAPESGRALPAEELAGVVRETVDVPVEVVADVGAAVERAREVALAMGADEAVSGPARGVVVTGSLRTAAEARERGA